MNESVTEADTFDLHDFSLIKFFQCHTNDECCALNIDDTDGSKRKKHPHWVAFGKYANSKYIKSFANLKNFADIDIACNFTSSLLVV